MLLIEKLNIVRTMKKESKPFMGFPKRSRRVHRRLLAETGGCCIYCGRRLDEFTASIDHIIPLSRGGKNESVNIVASCIPCNYLKYTFHVKDFIALLPFRKQRAFYNRIRTLCKQGKLSEDKYMLLSHEGGVSKISRIGIEIGRFQFRCVFLLNIRKK